jgi:hypothetical protein
MQFELTISIFDLNDILKELVSSTNAIDIYLSNKTSIERCVMINYDGNRQSIIVRKNDDLLAISIDTINRIEFRGFHKYKGQASKIFLIE